MDTHPDIEQIVTNIEAYEESQLTQLYLALRQKLSTNVEDRYSFGLTREGDQLLCFVLSRKSTIGGQQSLSDVIYTSQQDGISPKVWNGFNDTDRETFSRLTAYVTEVNGSRHARRSSHSISSVQQEDGFSASL